MNKLFILGTGNAMVTKCYNTCFTINEKDEHFLIDTGGGNGILSNLEKLNIKIENIHHLFISHSHNDHINGISWIIRAVANSMIKGTYIGNFYIYCHKELEHIIRTISSLILQNKFSKFIDDRIFFKNVDDGLSLKILSFEITFFNITSTKVLQFGFTANLKNDITLTFLGDEPYKDAVYKYCHDKDYLLHEAFCLYRDKHIFSPYEKHHTTVKEACENGSKLNAKNLILYHTEDKNIENRKELYTLEGKEFYTGNLLVPDDLDIIDLK